MKDIIILYWNKGGNVEKTAHQIQEIFGVQRTDVSDIESFNLDKIQDYKLIVAGGSTAGAEHWEDAKDDNQWNTFFINLAKKKVSGLNVALFGLGDQILYPNHFVNGLGVLNEEFLKLNSIMLGKWPIEGYDFNESDGVKEGEFYGLALDSDRQANMTPERITEWVKLITKEMA